MVKAYQSWKVYSHGPLEELEPNLLRVEGSLPGMDLKRVMTVARRTDGLLVIHNGIALEEPDMARIEALGEPGFIVVPNGFHRLDAKTFKDRYPSAKVVCPRGAVPKVEQVVSVDLTYDDMPADEDVTVRHAEGCGQLEGVMIVRHGETSSVVFNDLVFNMPHVSGFAGFVLRHLTASTGGPKISRIAKLFLIKDKKAFAEDLRVLADTPGLSRIIVSHHEVIEDRPAEILRELAASLG